jgi:HAD superfamily hydrolase (TIGR01509 family)
MTDRAWRPRAIVFDMDGTLLDTETLALRAWEEAAAAVGATFENELARTLIGRNFADSSTWLRAHFDARDYPIDEVLGGWHASYEALVEREGIVVKDGATQLLDWIRAAGIRCAVATSTRRERARAKLRDAGLLGHFVTVIGGDDVTHGKPAPDIYFAAAAALGVAAEDCLAIEDSEPGFRAAHAAGMTTILVPDLIVPCDELLELSPHIFDSLADVQRYLAALVSP